MHRASEILAILDACSEHGAFPVLDNGYVYLAAARLTAYRSERDWSLTVEVFGFSPRAGQPDTYVYTFGSSLANRPCETDFASREDIESNAAANPYNVESFFRPLDADWIGSDECVAPHAKHVLLRGASIKLPTQSQLIEAGIVPENPTGVAIHEVVRWIAETNRNAVLASYSERRRHVPGPLEELLTLDEWHHPDIAGGERPSGSEAFQQIAEALANNDPARYSPTEAPNTHWTNWPEGGTL